jgi:class 3 adenylate cyclase
VLLKRKFKGKDLGALALAGGGFGLFGIALARIALTTSGFFPKIFAFSLLMGVCLFVLRRLPSKKIPIVLRSASGLIARPRRISRLATWFLAATRRLETKFSRALGPNEDQAAVEGAQDASDRQRDEPTITFLERQRPVCREFIVLHGSIRSFNALVERTNPDDLASSLNEYFMIVSARVLSRGGRFERFGGSSFIGFWTQPVPAIQAALDLRQDLARLNEAFRLDGQKILSFSMGISSGVALAGKIGPPEDTRYSVFGEVVSCARALDRLCSVAAKDLLVSADVWKQSTVNARFFGDVLGEVKLTNDTGLVEYRTVGGYIDENGSQIQVDDALTQVGLPQEVGESDATKVRVLIPRKSEHWMVNNGSQILGPLSTDEVALRLFAQDLDFDCECWRDGGTPARIVDSQMFGPSSQPDADFWVFEGKTLHGPLTLGFLNTAIQRGAIAETSYVCEKSTVLGWKTFAAWQAEQVASKETSPETGPQAA